MRILLACDSVQSSQAMAEYLRLLNWPPESSWVLLTAVPSVLGRAIPKWLAAPRRSAEVEELIRAWVSEEKIALVKAEQQLHEVCTALPAVLQAAAPEVCQGHPADEIVAAAKKHASDLIVVGNKGSSPLGRFFIGSTCEAVLNRAPAPCWSCRIAERLALISDRHPGQNLA